MSRLADYFVVVGYDHEKERSGVSCGKIIQRFPEKDWKTCPFPQGIELFCQPTGWTLSTQRQPPSFFVSVLTDIDANRHYCACLTFYETVAISPTKPDDEDTDEQDSALVHHSLMFAPKSLLLVSRLSYFEAFKNCLGIMYTVYVENLQVQLESLVGNILGCVHVPPAGGPQVRFSIGAGDRQALQPPLNPTLPVTNVCVAQIFDELGINNVMTVLFAALTDHKILFTSQSYSRLTDACGAFIALQYPFKYSYVYIPILPVSLLEVLNTPTPFIAGIHSSLRNDAMDLVGPLDVIIVDLDGGSLHIPECVSIPVVNNITLFRTKKSLVEILKPDLLSADNAFPQSPQKQPSFAQKDKEIRSVFIRMFAELFNTYRSCLTIIRIHPEPFITFHKANFLGHRGMVDDDFVVRALDGMGFNAFVAERGPPYRVCDIFDEVYATIPDQLHEEKSNPSKMREHIKELAQQLTLNEHPNPQPYIPKVPKPTEGSYARIHQPPFPILNWNLIQEIIDEGTAKNSIKNKLVNVRPYQSRIVPNGKPISATGDRQSMVENNARRLEVLRNCVNFIFENKISDARIIFPAVLRALKSRVTRLALTQELSFHVHSNRAMLENQQFDLVVKLLNCALQNDSSLDESGVAAAILPLATAFCRKLCTGVIQFAYTCVQEHIVWQNHQFWEQSFYQDVQKQIRHLYLPQYEEHLMIEKAPDKSQSPLPTSNGNSHNRNSSATLESKRSSESSLHSREISALEIAAEQLRVWASVPKEQQQEMVLNEESTVYSQAIHYANRMVYMLVPLDVNRSHKNLAGFDGESNSNSNITTSIAESDSFDAESGFDETEHSDVGSNVIRFVTRFVDKVCNEGGVTQDHIKSLHQMIPGVVSMHIETLEAVSKESKRLPPIQKPKILNPTLLPGEEIVMEGLRIYLLPDGREEGTGGIVGGPNLLPAEGAVFLTTYRILFKGTPCDPLACEHIVIRSFPVSTLTREKKISVQYIPHIDQWVQEGLQLRSNVFQLMKIAFDEEVGSENVETFRKLANKVRNPPDVFSTYAFIGHMVQQATPLHKHKEKNASLRHFAKKTLLKTARKAGIKSKPSTHKQKYVLPTPPMLRKNISPRSSDSESERPSSEIFDDLSMIDENEFASSLSSDPKNLERLMERSSYQDLERLGLGTLSTPGQKSHSEPFRISTVNKSYSVCRSYPALLVVPQTVTDESIRKFARCHRQYRFPVICWRHPRTKGLLLRASGFHSRSLMGMLRHNPSTGTSSGEASSSIEQEKYFMLLVAATPSSSRSHNSASYSDSLTSLNSLMMVGGSDSLNIPETPDLHLRPSYKANSSSRGNGNRKNKPASLNRIGSLRGKNRMSSTSMDSQSQANGSLDYRGDLINSSVKGLHKVALYVLGEKTQMKGIKVESFPKCDFIPVDFFEVRHVKASFKKLMRACVPSTTTSSQTESTLYKAIEESEWLQQVQNVLQLAGATVDLLDVQGSSVMICLEDGWDVTTQVVSVAEILLDAHYRTIEGFKALVEKEWLSFGHRFTHRSNQTAANQASGFAPIFLQFLDIVHQIHHQFPLSFEFNQYFLKFLAYHYVSNRFRTFMMDSEVERVEAGLLLEGKHLLNIDDGDDELGFQLRYNHNSSLYSSVWDYIDKHHRRSPLFYNFLYSPDETVLRPYSNISNLKIWDYYLGEDLANGPSYDIEVANRELRQNEDQESEAMEISRRKILSGCYDNIMLQEPNFFEKQFMEMHQLEIDLGHLPQKWKVMWDKLESPVRDTVHRQVSFNTQLVRSHGRTIHKRSTLEILVKGKLLGEAARAFSQPHRFEKQAYTTPVYCDYCTQLLWGLSKTGMHCVDCGYNCHEKCQPFVPKSCTKLKTVADTSASSSNISQTGVSNTSSTSVATSQIYENFPANVGETRTHEGYLYKQGALLKGWKQRWFVLDSMKHQMRYYDAVEDSNCRGFIDLAEVESVQPVKGFPGTSKKSEDNSIFEIRTVRRQYNFMATSPAAAQEWIDKLQSCIQ